MRGQGPGHAVRVALPLGVQPADAYRPCGTCLVSPVELQDGLQRLHRLNRYLGHVSGLSARPPGPALFVRYDVWLRVFLGEAVSAILQAGP